MTYFFEQQTPSFREGRTRSGRAACARTEVGFVCVQLVLALTASLSFASTSTAQTRLNLIRPFAFTRGTESKLDVVGEKLEGAYPLVCYTEGLTHGEWTLQEDKRRMSTMITLADDFPTGWHAVRLFTPGGLSNVRMIYVSDSQLTFETREPHGPDAPQKLPHENMLEGRITREDSVDSYAIDLEGGQSLSVEIQALRIGLTMTDTRLRAFDPDGALVGECDDGGITSMDPYLRWTAAQTGTYRIDVSETRHEGRGNYWYLLHTGDFPRPAAASPPGAQSGAESEITWINGDGTQFIQEVSVPPDASGGFEVYPDDGEQRSVSPITLRVNDLKPAEESEPNNPFSKATEFNAPAALHGTISPAGDVDHFRFAGKKGQVIEARVYARSPGRSPLDAIMNIKRSSNQFITANDDAAGKPDSLIRVTLPEDDDYVLMIRDQRYRGGADYVYRIEVSAPKPRFALKSPDVARNQSAVVHVPQGNRMAALITVNRKDVAGPAALEFPDTPDGLSVECSEAPAERNRLPVLFSAAEDAEISAHLLSVTGIVTAGENQIEGKLALRQLLVNGRNNREVWGTTFDRLAMAVMPRSPVSIELAEPKVPIVRTGTMRLKIKAQREEGFAGPVTVRMLYNPNGVSSQDRVTIPADKDEALLTLTANDKATIGNWPIVCVGETNHEGNRHQFSTQLCPLNVADAFMQLAFEQRNLEQGSEAEFPVRVTYNAEFGETATAELVGLPQGVSAEAVRFKHGDETLRFKIVAAPNARPGRHGGVRCRITIDRDGEPITHLLGSGRIRVDKPLGKVTLK